VEGERDKDRRQMADTNRSKKRRAGETIKSTREGKGRARDRERDTEYGTGKDAGKCTDNLRTLKITFRNCYYIIIVIIFFVIYLSLIDEREAENSRGHSGRERKEQRKDAGTPSKGRETIWESARTATTTLK